MSSLVYGMRRERCANIQVRMEQFQKAIRKVRQVQRMRKQRGYAFSQTDESQARVLQAYDTTQERGRYGEMASSRTGT